VVKKHILFVDDEQEILDALRRMLHPMSDRWDMVFEGNGRRALDLMAKNPFDVIIADMQMPGMNGVELLGRVKKRHPYVIRIILSGISDIGLIPQVLPVVHQFLGKPVDSKRIISTITRACAVKDMFTNDTLSEVILRMDTLPSHPVLYTELRDELRKQEPSTKRLGDIISRDMGLTLKLCQLCYSGYIAGSQMALEPRQAVNIIGISTIRDIADAATVLPGYNKALFATPPLRDLWEHCFRTARIAKVIAQVEDFDQETMVETYLATFLHDIGKIILAVHLPDEYALMLSLAENHGMRQFAAEKQVFGSGHSGVGAPLLALWGLPASVVLPVAHHDEPSRCQDKEMMVQTAIVHTADIFQHAATTEDRVYVEDIFATPSNDS